MIDLLLRLHCSVARCGVVALAAMSNMIDVLSDVAIARNVHVAFNTTCSCIYDCIVWL